MQNYHRHIGIPYGKYHRDNSNNIKAHGGYKNLRSFQTATLIYDLTTEFCRLYIGKPSRTIDQMIQAARSGRQNTCPPSLRSGAGRRVAEGSQASGTSKKTEIKLVGVARASLEELLLDYEDFLRQRKLEIWNKDDPRAKEIRSLTYKTDKSYETYKSYLKKPETAVNCLICLINQANFLLDRQVQSLEKSFVEEGGYTENLFRKRFNQRNKL